MRTTAARAGAGAVAVGVVLAPTTALPATAADAMDDSAPAIGPVDLPLAAGVSYTAVVSGLENPDEKVLNLPAGTVSAAVAAAGTADPVIGPADVAVTEGVNTIVYAWGSLADDDLALAVQTIEGLRSAPAGVPTGELGLAADAGSDGGSSSMPLALATGVLVAAAGVVLMARRRTVEIAARTARD